jgi:hypothetical protein
MDQGTRGELLDPTGTAGEHREVGTDRGLDASLGGE